VEQHFEQVEAVTWQDRLRFTDPEPFTRFSRWPTTTAVVNTSMVRLALSTSQSSVSTVVREVVPAPDAHDLGQQLGGDRREAVCA
jgi:hypothetical protein